jgi:hypothetical protein
LRRDENFHTLSRMIAAGESAGRLHFGIISMVKPADAKQAIAQGCETARLKDWMFSPQIVSSNATTRQIVMQVPFSHLTSQVAG